MQRHPLLYNVSVQSKMNEFDFIKLKSPLLFDISTESVPNKDVIDFMGYDFYIIIDYYFISSKGVFQ